MHKKTNMNQLSIREKRAKFNNLRKIACKQRTKIKHLERQVMRNRGHIKNLQTEMIEHATRGDFKGVSSSMCAAANSALFKEKEKTISFIEGMRRNM